MNNQELINYLAKGVDALRNYHNHEVIGLDHIPSVGRSLIVFNHSLATYDIALLFGAIFKRYDRIPRPLADNLFFKIPHLGPLVESIGVAQGTSENAYSMLNNEELVAVAPGGMKEALKPSAEKYTLKWADRKGFVKLAIETKTPVVLAMCPHADDLYEVYNHSITRWAYENLKIPVPIAKGVGFSPIPKPVALKHYLSKPMMPPAKSQTQSGLTRQINNFHKKLTLEANALIEKALAQD